MSYYLLFTWLLFFLFSMFPISTYGQFDETCPEPEQWKINGTLAALDDANPKVQLRALNKLGDLKSKLPGLISKIGHFLEKWQDDAHILATINFLYQMPDVAKVNVTEIVKLLEHQDPEVRRSAVEILGEMPDAANVHVAKIVKLLEDQDSEVRKSAVGVLGEMPDAANVHVAKIVKLLEDKDSEVSRVAVLALDKMPDVTKVNLTEIVKLLEHRDSYVRRSAFWALCRMPDVVKVNVTEIVKLLEHQDSNVRRSAVGVLGEMPDAAKVHVAEIVKLLEDQDSNVRRSAVGVLGEMSDAAKVHVAEIVKLLEDQDSNVRRSAVGVLGEMPDTAKVYVTEIVKLLEDQDSKVRREAVWVLGKMPDVTKMHKTEIVKLLEDQGWDVLEAAAKVLSEMSDAVKVHQSEAVKLFKEDIVTFVKLLKHQDLDSRRVVVEVLHEMSDPANVQHIEIVKLLEDQGWDVLEAAVKVLSKIPDVAKMHKTEIVKLLEDQGWDVLGAAVKVLSEMPDTTKVHVAEIVKLLEDKDSDVRRATVKVLSEMPDVAKVNVTGIVKLLEHQDSNVRRSAVRVLGEMPDVAKVNVTEIVKLLEHQDSDVRRSAVGVLGEMPDAAKVHVAEIVKLLEDQDSNVRRSAVLALDKMPDAAKVHRKEIVKLLEHQDLGVRNDIVDILEDMGQLDIEDILYILNLGYGNDQQVGELRFFAHFFGAGDLKAETLIRWLGIPNKSPLDYINREEGVKTLRVFADIWKTSLSFDRLRKDLENQIALIAEKFAMFPWKQNEIDLLKLHVFNLMNLKPKSTHAASVQKIVDYLEPKKLVKWWGFLVGRFLLCHMFFWIVIICLYTKSSKIQAIFFWNPWVRRITGIGYVSIILIWIPFLRKRLFAPFRETLLSDASLERFDPQAYFEDSDVKIKESGKIQPIKKTIPEIKGHIILEGASGLGKTMFVCYLLNRSKRVVVYLQAKNCSAGVEKAIQDKLHGKAKELEFLKSLIYSGAIDICIDGLNEVTAETRAKVILFAESYSKANIIIATQPLDWVPPATSKTNIMQPLTQDQIENFLITRKESLLKDSEMSSICYEDACKKYLTEAFKKDQHKETLNTTIRYLSNPMDLDLVAQLLVGGEKPNLLCLQEQQYKIMAKDYKQVYLNNDFPLMQFSEKIYQATLEEKEPILTDKYLKELQLMERYKLVVKREYEVDTMGNSKREYFFRHDKIKDFFILQKFLGPNNDKPLKHLDDARFRGVYFMLANLMPLEQAEKLREHLINYAADTKDHIVSDTFIQILRFRKTF